MPTPAPKSTEKPTTGQVWFSLMPWIIVCVVLLVWGTGWFKAAVNPYATWSYPVPELHNLIQKVPPVAAKPTPEPAVFAFTWLTYTGSGMLIAAILSGLLMGFGPIRLVTAYAKTIRVTLASLITISAMLAIGTLTRFSGLDATLGLAFAGTGVLYPFFGTCSAGVALTGWTPRPTCCSKPAEFSSSQAVADPDVGGQLVRRRDGQDDRRAVDRGGVHGYQLPGHEGRSALRVLALDRWPARSASW